MAYTWSTTYSASDVLSGKGVKTTGKWIFDNQNALKQIRRFHLHTGTQTEMLLVATQQIEVPFRVPRYARPGGTDVFEFQQYLYATAGVTAHIRIDLNDGTNTTTGTEITTTSTSSTNVMSGPSRVAIPTDMLADNVSGVLRLYLWVSGGVGTATTASSNLMFNCGVDS